MEQITREELIGLVEITRLLSEAGGETEVAKKAEQAIAALQAAEPVAVLCRETGLVDTSWFEHEPLIPGSRTCEHRADSVGWETLEVFTLPCPPAKAQVPIGDFIEEMSSDPEFVKGLEEGRQWIKDQNLTWCDCGDGYPANSYGAAFIDIFGHCENCHMGSETVDPAAQVESWAGGFRISPMGNIERLRDGMFLYSCPNLPYEAQGWKLVPIEPTPDMTLQGALAGVEHGNGEFSQKGAEAVYKAMLTASPASDPDACTPAMEAAAEKYWKERRFKGLSEDPRTWKGLYKAMCAARQQEEAER